VIGIVASKLVETFLIPAIVFTRSEEGKIKASARTAGELNLFDALNECSEFFLKFGGHKAAAGLTMLEENLGAFTEKIKLVVKRKPEILRTKSISYDIELRPQDITPSLVRSLDLLEPFGPGNERPIFCLRDLKVASVDYLKEVHVRWNFESATNPKFKFKGISFNYLGKWGRIHPNDFLRPGKMAQQTATAYFTLGINRFNGNEFIQLMVDKVE
jgi:single-stranded-DNA-specific exonuclease